MLYKFHNNTIQYFCQRKYKQNILKAKVRLKSVFYTTKIPNLSKSKISKGGLFKAFFKKNFTFYQNFRLTKSPKAPFATRIYGTFTMVFNWGWLTSTIKSTVPFGMVLFCFMVELTILPAFNAS